MTMTMMTTARSLAAALAAITPLAHAMQPDAVPPLPAPMRPLPWGQINFLHTTDTHGWHGGHLQESQYSADWGDYVSFATHLRRRAEDEGVDLLLVDTGDRVEGNGLYDASTPKGAYTYDVFKQQHIDILCSGNHELYQADTVDREHHIMVPNFAGHYLASNLDYVDPQTGERVPMAAQRYRAFTTPRQNISIVAFGFLFNFTSNAANSVVQPVQQTVREPWFHHAITNELADVFVVTGHIGARMEELRVIYEAIRSVNPHTPIALFAGHAHVRDAVRFDDKAVAIASGRYLETIGWMSVSGVKHEGGVVAGAVQPVTFARRYIDSNLLGMYYHSGTDAATFPTDHGLNLTASIAAARSDLRLDTVYGCAPQNYWLQRRPYDHTASVFSLLQNHVLPEAIVREDRAEKPRLFIMNTGAIRFDIFRGAFTRDTTYIVSPFISRVNYIPDVPSALAWQVLPILNSYGPILSAMAAEEAARFPGGPGSFRDWREMGVPEQYAPKDESGESGGIFRSEAAKARVGQDPRQKPLSGSLNRGDGQDNDSAARPPLVAGYTTRDDLGDDGDDAIHEPLPYFWLPNCIQAEVNLGDAAHPTEHGEEDTVDLVFFDFIQNFVLQALSYAKGRTDVGRDYTNEDIQVYVDGTFTEHFTDWISQNWKNNC